MSLPNDFVQRAKKIKCVIFDVDGVLTDGRLFFDLNGQEYKSFNVQDGQGLKILQQQGVHVAIISGRSSSIVMERMRGLGIEHVYLGHENKISAFNDVLSSLKLSSEEIAHVGDDLPDLAIMMRVGLAIAVADANPSVLPHCHWQTTRKGGSGAAREVCDAILNAQDNLSAAVKNFTHAK
ncbi:MAG: 3-deoxy-D-manno-octulosonate 8-phosphate phosphatase [Cycloclasticus sp. symbiont of Poecilosclerida sp. M]|nr:MAG: 3-deoxy-D-manno-octulosonate 8-phosphate phosphatase [Cycloclasticus sp. symbiont of Poecilosclerida sp. M]